MILKQNWHSSGAATVIGAEEVAAVVITGTSVASVVKVVGVTIILFFCDPGMKLAVSFSFHHYFLSTATARFV